MKMQRVMLVLAVVVALGVAVAACAPPDVPVSNPITDIPANQPDRDGGGHTQCAKETVPSGFGVSYDRWYNIVTGDRFEDLIGCLFGGDPVFRGEPGRSPYDSTWVVVDTGDPLALAA